MPRFDTRRNNAAVDKGELSMGTYNHWWWGTKEMEIMKVEQWQMRNKMSIWRLVRR
jgi:hypothetical protein